MLHFMVVEMIKKQRQPLVRSYYIDIPKDKKYSLPKSNCAYLLIDVSGTVDVVSSGSMRRLQADDYVFFPPQSGVEINGGNAHCVLVEL